METKILDLTTPEQKVAGLMKASQILRSGGLVAFPTETVYGLGADALRPEAAEKIYLAKGRPSDNPLIVHVAKKEDVKRVTVNISQKAEKLMDAFWPGPLTMVFQKTEDVPETTTGGLNTVAVRMPDHELALELIETSGCLLAGPSANLSGRPSPTKWEHVYEDLSGKIDAVIKAESCRVGIESTVLDMTEDPPVILRPGAITAEQIQAVTGGKVVMDPALKIHRPRDEGDDSDPAPKAPGMKYRHYAPKADMYILKGSRLAVRAELERITADKEAQGLKVGILFSQSVGVVLASRDFFSRLRELDEQGVDLILAEAFDEQDPVSFALMNRMLKSAGYRVIEVDQEK